MKAAAVSSQPIPIRQDAVSEVMAERRLSLASNSMPHARGQTSKIHLTPRQMEVLFLLCEGLPNKLICRRLGISAGTVKAHICSILRELGVGSRLQAVVAARRMGLVLEPDSAVEPVRASEGHSGIAGAAPGLLYEPERLRQR